MEEHASDIQKILVEMEKARNIFPNEEEEEVDEVAALSLEESRPFPNPWREWITTFFSIKWKVIDRSIAIRLSIGL